MRFVYYVVLLSPLLASGGQTAKHPQKPASAYFHICHRSDPEISSCARNTIEDLRPRLIKGIPELDIVPLEPLSVPRLEFKEGSGNFKFTQVLTNLTIHGLGAFQLQNVKIDLNNFTLDIDMVTPFMMFKADYQMEGKILLVPLSGKGDSVLNFTGVTTNSHTVLQVVNRDGEQFLHVQDIQWTIAAKDCHIQFNNLFGGDKTLGEATNKFLNENWREAFNTYRYLPEEAFGILFKDFSNKVFQQYPLKELFPE